MCNVLVNPVELGGIVMLAHDQIRVVQEIEVANQKFDDPANFDIDAALRQLLKTVQLSSVDTGVRSLLPARIPFCPASTGSEQL